MTLFLGDKNSPYYKPGSIEELANHIVRYLSGYKNSPYYKPGSIEELANHIVRYLSGYI